MKINVIKREGQAVLVEWRDGDELKRVTVPSEDVHGNQVTRDNLDKGIVYGAQWDDLALEWPTSAEFAALLRGAGIWTKQDALGGMAIIRGLVSGIVNQQVKRLRDFARN